MAAAKPPPPALDRAQKEALLRWRLCLGRNSDAASAMGLSFGSVGVGLDGFPGEGLTLGGRPLDAKGLTDLDASLEFIYGGGPQDGGRPAPRSAGLGASSPYVHPKLGTWLANIRKFFNKDTVALVQKDAIERKNLKQLLFEPETLPYLEKNVDLVSTLLAAKDLIPSKAKEMAREVVREVVDQLMRELENDVRQVITGALRMTLHSPLPVYRNIDWKRTISRNLKNYDPEKRRVVPERVYFWGNQKRFHEWQVVLCVDQSGSMGESVVYSSVMAAIFASLPVLDTKLVFFDTEVVDMTEHLADPVDVIFGAQLGGGTDIAKAVSYCADLVADPEKTIFVLITDLYEGGSLERMFGTLGGMKESKVNAVCLLALSDSGVPSFDRENAARLREMDIPAFACTPKRLVDLMARVIKGLPFDDLATPVEDEKR